MKIRTLVAAVAIAVGGGSALAQPDTSRTTTTTTETHSSHSEVAPAHHAAAKARAAAHRANHRVRHAARHARRAHHEHVVTTTRHTEHHTNMQRDEPAANSQDRQSRMDHAYEGWKKNSS